MITTNTVIHKGAQDLGHLPRRSMTGLKRPKENTMIIVKTLTHKGAQDLGHLLGRPTTSLNMLLDPASTKRKGVDRARTPSSPPTP